MIITGINNQTVELRITNYQFSDTNDRDWYGNWLSIYLKIKSDVGNWQTIDSSLTYWEVKQLIEWFKDLAINKRPEWIDQEFTEPNLSFRLLNEIESDRKKIRILFALESRPQSASDDKEYFVDFEADKEKLTKIAKDLQTELNKYPER